MYVVTGGAGFIGSQIVRTLNDRGIDTILVVDDLHNGEKFHNLADCVIFDYMDRTEFRQTMERGTLPANITAILHQGACANTMEQDGRYMMEMNFSDSKNILQYALSKEIPFVYASSASVYGTGRIAREEPAYERPINVYAYSKLTFDQHVRKILPTAKSTVVGLRYFNVYGSREAQKGKMASMVFQLYQQVLAIGVARLFEGTDGFANGEQRRDFVSVEDVVKVNLYFADGPVRKGIYNVATGTSRSFNDVAKTIIGQVGKGTIEYIPFPKSLQGKYQSFTEADLTTLRTSGYTDEFLTLEEGIRQMIQNMI